MSLTKKTVRNLSAFGLLQVFVKIANAITLVILARLLLPSDFGIVAIAGILIAIADQFKDFGMSNAVIQKKEYSEVSLQTGFIIRSIIVIFLFISVFIAAPFWADFFDNQVITPVLRILAIILILENFSFMPSTRLAKELQFRTIVFSSFLGYVSYSAVAIFMALNGYSFWSIVYGRISQSLVSSIYFWIVSPFEFHLRFDKKIARELLNYGKYIFGTGFIVLMINNFNYVVLGKILGSMALGYYLIAYSWATFSAREVMAVLYRVLFPTYSFIQHDIQRLGNAFLKTLKYTSLVSIPIAFGTFAIAPEFVRIALGEKWEPSILPLQILCIAGVLQSINSTTGSLYYSIGKPKITTLMGGVQLLLMIIFIVPAAEFFGITGAAVLFSFLSIIITPLNFNFLGKYLGIEKGRFIEILTPPAISAFLMTAFILMIKEYIKVFDIVSEYPLIHLMFLVLSGIIIYILSLFILTNGTIKEDIRVITSNLLSR